MKTDKGALLDHVGQQNHEEFAEISCLVCFPGAVWTSKLTEKEYAKTHLVFVVQDGQAIQGPEDAEKENIMQGMVYEFNSLSWLV